MSSLTRIQMVIHLQSVNLFAYCTAEQMVRLASIAREQVFHRGEYLYSVSDPAEHLYCLVEGEVELRLPPSKVGSGQGEPVTLTTAPGTFGAREILSDEPRRREARALTDGVALTFDADDLFDLLSNNIEIVKALFRQLLRPQGPEKRPETSRENGPVSDESKALGSSREGSAMEEGEAVVAHVG